jgi:L-seryl-tRNA(Ser) seleniumtransferase
MTEDALKRIPSMDVLLGDPRLQPLIDRFSRGRIKMELHRIIDGVRQEVRSASISVTTDLGESIVDRLMSEARSGRFSTLNRVINATGIILHTNLGRAILPRGAIEAVEAVSRGYCSLEYDMERGERGSRHVHCERIIRYVTGAEAALVVNNNAAAVTLVLNTFSNDREAVISRGELVEIGGSFRMPEIMAKSGALMVEVGTTNKTKLDDYRAALSDRTGILVKVHKSNFTVSGFVDEVGIEELAGLSRETSIPLLYDQGSGVLLSLEGCGVVGESTVRDCLRKGASIVCFSGDKILGGPQAGIIVGERELIGRVRSNPLTRTYRVDKFTLAALEATLSLYLEPERAFREVPVLQMLTASVQQLSERARSIVASLDDRTRGTVSVRDVDGEVGGGSLPSAAIPSVAVVVDAGREAVNHLENRARGWTPPIIGRISRDRFLLDLRTVAREEDPEIVSFLRASLEGGRDG